MHERFRHLKVGCCGFTMAHSEYYAHFPLIEVQQTFYQPPRLSTLERWRDEAPEGFEFSVKAWQLITHVATIPTYRRLKRQLTEEEKATAGNFRLSPIVREGWEVTAACARALRAQRILFQCPPSFQPTDENIVNLVTFFSSVDREGRTFLWEPRGGWPHDLVRNICDELDLVHVVDPLQQDSVTPDQPYYRLHGVKGRPRYNDEELTAIFDLIPDDIPTHLLFNNVGMREDALIFLEMLAART